ncbi:DUF6438 domain-containing protein [Hymenobacter ruber]
MKLKSLLTLLLILLYLAANAQIDTLRSKVGIEAYLKHRYHYKSIQLKEVNSIIKDSTALPASDPKYWLKADFNHDEKIDLFVAASVDEGKRGVHDLFLVLASDHKHYSKVDIGHPLDYWMHGGTTSWAIYSKSNRDYLVMHCLTSKIPRLKTGGWGNRLAYSVTHDTLFVIDAKPIIHATHPSKLIIESIKFSTTQCFGTCPVFQLVIKQDGSVSYKGIEYVEKKGDFNLIMTKSELNYLNKLLANLNLPYLEDNYQVDYTDSQTAYLTIRYTNGQTKEIEDYGLQGTFGLATLYSFLFGLRNF